MSAPTPPRIPRTSLLGAAATALVLLSGCAAWTAGDSAAPRASVSLSSPSSIQRSERVQREVARMDAEAFPGGGMTLKLSYQLSPALAQAVVAQLAANH